ncbi:DUF4142 domain-containing protein [Mucilaginibacter sp. UR6-1]|uniref:DUF4142 domain-containing protein n=1 Tax=Mucilaginibacter sp. UR6-1 TaxID=1435643 RepID=UPI001E60DF2E|nr:DUF4142 domain-containing protein [Mucilaginibacter sp. UR6-1]MCC8407979.1 DUF4142 domain-containing protein [Mucilaginibacter sp. UR6-1]
MRRAVAIGLLFLAVIGLGACKDKRKAQNYNLHVLVDDDGLAFIRKAAESGIAEVEASNIAKATSKNQQVVKFATMLADQHAAINEELKTLQTRNMVSTNDTISLEKQQAIADLAKNTGVEFDRKYINMMVKDHEEAVKIFSSGTSIRISSVNKFANKHLAELKAHLDTAKQISASLK